jgi:hypothetical protein
VLDAADTGVGSLLDFYREGNMTGERQPQPRRLFGNREENVAGSVIVNLDKVQPRRFRSATACLASWAFFTRRR